jgi:hypothetical protein
MSYYQVEMHHDEASLIALSKMQYNLFCQSNRISRAVISFCLLVLAVMNLGQWWSYLIIVYAVYLTSSTSVTATRAARKLSQKIESAGTGYPASRFTFGEENLHIAELPIKKSEKDTVLPYSKFYRLAEDKSYFYIFRDRFGGYMIPKEALGEKAKAFRTFLESKTESTCFAGTSPLLRLFSVLRRRSAKT